MYKPALSLGFLFAAIGVVVGALGAHALHDVLSQNQLVATYETAVKYQMYHSFALMLAGILHLFVPGRWIKAASWCFLIGILLFSGSIFALVYLKTTAAIGLGGLGMLTPIGGVFFILGWAFLLLGVNTRGRVKALDDRSE